MKQTPFHSVPEGKFLIRMILPGFLGMFAGILVTGMLASGQSFQRLPAAAAGTDPDATHLIRATPPAPPKHPGLIQRATYHVGMFAWDLTHIPAGCGFGGTTVNEVQRNRCEEFTNQQWLNATIVLIPFLLPALMLLVALDFFRRTFRIARKRLQAGEKVQLGKVTNPPTLPNDVFGWFHCCSTICVQLPDKRQVKVYVPSTGGQPKPGETLAVVDIGVSMGAARHLGFVYAPHVAVMRGG